MKLNKFLLSTILILIPILSLPVPPAETSSSCNRDHDTMPSNLLSPISPLFCCSSPSPLSGRFNAHFESPDLRIYDRMLCYLSPFFSIPHLYLHLKLNAL